MNNLDPELAIVVEHLRIGRLAEAKAACVKLLADVPSSSAANHLMGRITSAMGDVAGSAEWYTKATVLAGNSGRFHHDLAVALSQLGKTTEAVKAFELAVELTPGAFGPTMNLARELAADGRHTGAEAMARRAAALRPSSADAYFAIASALQKQGRLDDALTAYSETLARNPSAPFKSLTASAGLLEKLGRTSEAIDFHRRAVAASPGRSWLHSNYLYSLRYSEVEERNPAAVFREHAGWAQKYARAFYRSMTPPENDRTPDRRLRIAYLSADFRRHSASNGIETLIRHHDRSAWDVWCYSDIPKSDDVTERFRAAANAWRDVRGVADEQVARMIRADGIDVLVDHTGHMGGNRMMVFARRPAPVQVAFPGYPGTTGLEVIDAFVTDAHQDPSGQTDQFYTEKLVRMTGSPRCYTPPVDAPDVTPLPADSAGRGITFAVIQRPGKLSDRMFKLWGKVLDGVPGSKLVLLLSDAAARDLERTLRPRLERHGIPQSRVELIGRLKVRQYRQLFGRLDVVLDTQPYTGCVTTMDALWMGVPVVTLAGRTYVARVGASILAQLGLTERLVAGTDEQYVRLATTLASDIGALRELRATLRQRMRVSPLIDARRVTAEFEAVCRSLWQAWCATRVGSAVDP